MSFKVKKFLRRRNLIYMAKKSVGSDIWQHAYVLTEDGRVHDVYENGNLSCAYWLTSLLKTNEMYKFPTAANVKRVLDNLPDAGWHEIDEPRTGCLVMYGPRQLDRAWATWHCGIYIGGGRVISNNSNPGGVVIEHDLNLKLDNGSVREIHSYWWNDVFESDEEFEAEEETLRIRTTVEEGYVNTENDLQGKKRVYPERTKLTSNDIDSK